ncbi:hypothetical protein SLE2022_254590 [Rubroshorea leprosula]
MMGRGCWFPPQILSRKGKNLLLRSPIWGRILIVGKSMKFHLLSLCLVRSGASITVTLPPCLPGASRACHVTSRRRANCNGSPHAKVRLGHPTPPQKAAADAASQSADTLEHALQPAMA